MLDTTATAGHPYDPPTMGYPPQLAKAMLERASRADRAARTDR